jgi:hypothetical protein
MPGRSSRWTSATWVEPILADARHDQEDSHQRGGEAGRVVNVVPDRRFAEDAAAHRRDLPRFCPSCGAGLDRGIATEFWEAADRRFYCWCPRCRWTGEIIPTGPTAIGHEPEH